MIALYLELFHFDGTPIAITGWGILICLLIFGAAAAKQ